MKTSDRLLSPERGLFHDKYPERPPLEWFVFVINELCPRALIWGKVHRGKGMLHVAAQEHGYSKDEIDEFIDQKDFIQSGKYIRGNFADIHAEEHCFAILTEGCDGQKETEIPTLL